MIRHRYAVLISTLVCFAGLLPLLSPSLLHSAENAKQSTVDGELKLEELFPEKSLFGPSASSAAFSSDGRYAAYLYRPYEERRHGRDLWI